MARHSQVTYLEIAKSDTAGNDPRHSEISFIALEAVDTSGSLDPRHSEITYLSIDSVSVLVDLTPPFVSKSLVTVTLTATLIDGTLADSWVWSQEGGTTVSLSPQGNTCAFTTPATTDGDDIVIGVVGTKAGEDSPLTTTTVTVRPHMRWRKTASGWEAVRGAMIA